MKVTFNVRVARLRRLLEHGLIADRRLARKVAKLVKGEDVMFSVAEVSDLRVATRHRAKPLSAGAKFTASALQAAVFLLVA
jgi:hypothetical protein